MLVITAFICNAQSTNVVLDINEIKEQLQPITQCIDLGYYSGEPNKITSSVTEIKPDHLEQRAIFSIDQLLQGRVPGLNVSTTSGQPDDKIGMTIRGRSSINGSNEPLLILDGAPIALESLRILNPNDVYSISVLKDAGSTAIYGIRGGNGVIVITTKS